MNKPVDPSDLSELVELDRAHVWHHLSPHRAIAAGEKDPLVIVRGEGMRIWDQNGKEHLDAVSGAVWTVNLGYGRDAHRRRGARPARRDVLLRGLGRQPARASATPSA